jgi:prevent-host-death family protein
MVKIKSSFGAFEAKTHFSDLLDRVERGDRITITRHGRVVATLAPANPKVRKDLLKLGREALAITAGTTLPKGMSLEDVVNAGRKR